MHDGIWRSYRIFTPTGHSPGQNYPLVINMHGYGSNSSDQMAYSEMNNVADTSGFIVVYPEGINNAWNAGFMNPYHSGVDDVGFLSKMIDTLDRDFGIDPCRVYSTGMSNGGFMSHRLACELHSKITAIAGVTGMITDSTKFYCQNQRAVPVLQIQGTSDGVVYYTGGTGYSSAPDCIEFWAQKNTCNMTADTTNFPDVNTSDNSTVTSIRYHNNCSDSAEAILYRVNNGGHTWPGAMPVSSLGNTNQDIHASVEVWNFFKKYDCSNTSVSIEESTSIDQPEFNIYPNPVYSKTKIEGNEIINRYALVNNQGQTIRKKTVNKNSFFINMNGLPNGIYFVIMFTDNKYYSSKIIKR